MAENKTQKTDASVLEFINSVDHKKRKEDALVLLDIFKEETGEEPALWGPSIIGFGDYRYEYASGRSGDWFYCGFSPRKASMSLYIMAGFKKFPDLMKNLGKHKTGASCIYVNKLEDIDLEVLRSLIRESVKHLKNKPSN